MIVKYGTGHFSGCYIVQSLGQSVNAYQVDILANGTASCLDGLQSAKCHCVVVTEYNFYIITILA